MAAELLRKVPTTSRMNTMMSCTTMALVEMLRMEAAIVWGICSLTRT